MRQDCGGIARLLQPLRDRELGAVGDALRLEHLAPLCAIRREHLLTPFAQHVHYIREGLRGELLGENARGNESALLPSMDLYARKLDKAQMKLWF